MIFRKFNFRIYLVSVIVGNVIYFLFIKWQKLRHIRIKLKNTFFQAEKHMINATARISNTQCNYYLNYIKYLNLNIYIKIFKLNYTIIR